MLTKENNLVIVDFLGKNFKGLEKQIYNSSRIIGIEEEARRVKAVFIKPNLTYPVFKKGVTTRLEFVRILVGVLKKT